MQYRDANDPFFYWYTKKGAFGQCEVCGFRVFSKRLPGVIAQMQKHYRSKTPMIAEAAERYRQTVLEFGDEIPF